VRRQPTGLRPLFRTPLLSPPASPAAPRAPRRAHNKNRTEKKPAQAPNAHPLLHTPGPAAAAVTARRLGRQRPPRPWPRRPLSPKALPARSRVMLMSLRAPLTQVQAHPSPARAGCGTAAARRRAACGTHTHTPLACTGPAAPASKSTPVSRRQCISALRPRGTGSGLLPYRCCAWTLPAGPRLAQGGNQACCAASPFVVRPRTPAHPHARPITGPLTARLRPPAPATAPTAQQRASSPRRRAPAPGTKPLLALPATNAHGCLFAPADATTRRPPPFPASMRHARAWRGCPLPSAHPPRLPALRMVLWCPLELQNVAQEWLAGVGPGGGGRGAAATGRARRRRGRAAGRRGAAARTWPAAAARPRHAHSNPRANTRFPTPNDTPADLRPRPIGA
jgi:hypothetical protein